MHLLQYCSTQEVGLSNDISFYIFFSRSLNLEQENREKDKDKQYAATTDGENSKCTCGWDPTACLIVAARILMLLIKAHGI